MGVGSAVYVLCSVYAPFHSVHFLGPCMSSLSFLPYSCSMIPLVSFLSVPFFFSPFPFLLFRFTSAFFASHHLYPSVLSFPFTKFPSMLSLFYLILSITFAYIYSPFSFSSFSFFVIHLFFHIIHFSCPINASLFPSRFLSFYSHFFCFPFHSSYSKSSAFYMFILFHLYDISSTSFST